MIQTQILSLPHGIQLSCRSAGEPGREALIFLHGFPQAAFIWDNTLEFFAARGFYCIAPNLRGFEHSSSPADPALYRPKHIVQDIEALIAQLSPHRPLKALVAHDWGGAVAWNLANQKPQLMQRLVIINSPHPGTFLRDLKSDPVQQQASMYMHFLSRPDAEKLLSENDFARLFEFFTRLGAADGAYAWLDETKRAQYRALWQIGLAGACNYYRASPLKPPLDASSPIHGIELPPEALHIALPTQVIWGMRDIALPPGLLRGLEAYIPKLRLDKIEDATHWVIDEQPGKVQALIEEFFNTN